jgi:hypothetical protein
VVISKCDLVPHNHHRQFAFYSIANNIDDSCSRRLIVGVAEVFCGLNFFRMKVAPLVVIWNSACFVDLATISVAVELGFTFRVIHSVKTFVS